MQVSWINKYLPLDKKRGGTGLDASKLKKLADASPIRMLKSKAGSIASSDNGSNKNSDYGRKINMSGTLKS